MPDFFAALVGSPNTGKSALFNALTGSHQKVGNFPGVTVEKKIGQIIADNRPINIVDLPGTYSLDPLSSDEEVTLNVLLNQSNFATAPSLILATCDANNLKRTLGLCLDLKKLNIPIIVVLNKADIANQNHIEIDTDILKSELGVTDVIKTTAPTGMGIAQLKTRVIELFHKYQQSNVAPSNSQLSAAEICPTDEELQSRFKQVDAIITKAVKVTGQSKSLTNKLDNYFLHPIWGPVLLVGILMTMFQAIFSWAEVPMDWIESGFEAFGATITALLPKGYVQSFLVDGVIAGIGSVVVFLPQILLTFLFIFILEGSGYMMRASMLMNRIMKFAGLQGLAFVPLLSSFACAIPGIMATRTLKSHRERLLTISLAPLMTCSARLPVYILLIGAFVPNTTILGFFNLQGLVLFGLFLFGIISAIALGFIFRKTLLAGASSPFIFELPDYLLPNFKYISKQLWMRTRIFLKKAGTVILLVSIGLWVLSTFPRPPEGAKDPSINYSLAGKIGHFIEPSLRPLGFDWRIATGLIPGFAAREVMVGALATVFAVEASEDDEEALMSSLQEKLSSTWGLPTALALLVWYVFSPQCLATFAVIRRETGNWKWPGFMFMYLLVLAYIFAFITFQVSSLLL